MPVGDGEGNHRQRQQRGGGRGGVVPVVGVVGTGGSIGRCQACVGRVMGTLEPANRCQLSSVRGMVGAQAPQTPSSVRLRSGPGFARQASSLWPGLAATGDRNTKL